jgi:hypothetical protein
MAEQSSPVRLHGILRQKLAYYIYRYIYNLFTSIDGNYRQWNRAHKHGDADPTLSPGWAYTVAPDVLRAHLLNYDFQNEVSMRCP